MSALSPRLLSLSHVEIAIEQAVEMNIFRGGFFESGSL